MGSAGESTGHHALVFGASGIIGWGIVNTIINGYPEPSTFSKVTAITNRPLTPEVAQWPESDKLNIVSGLDLLKGSQSELEETMKARIAGVDTVSHVYFCAYIMDIDPAKEIQINVDLLQRAVSATDNLSKTLKFVVLPTGTKAYGVHLPGDVFPHSNNLPLKESHPRIPEPYASQLFYYNQLDLLKSLSSSRSWTFCNVIPDIIIGFVPNNNIFGISQTFALFLSLYRYINGEGAEIAFPGTMNCWENKTNDSSQDIVAKFAIHASLHPEVSDGQSFNVADNSTPSNWSKKWHIVCDYFGLKGVSPVNGPGPDPTGYVSENRDKWLELEKEYGLQGGRAGNDRSYNGFSYLIPSVLDFDRQLDLSKMHDAWGKGGTVEETDTKGAWHGVFDRFRKAKIIP